jgi:hypothetical protein
MPISDPSSRNKSQIEKQKLKHGFRRPRFAPNRMLVVWAKMNF